MSKEMGEKMSKIGTLIEPVPGHAHWQNGKVERMIQTIFDVSDKIVTEDKITREESVRLACRAHNRNCGGKGFSPFQYALGRNPNVIGSMVSGEDERETGMEEYNLKEMIRLRVKAEEAYLRAQ